MVTIRDVAKLSGVSTATVSRVLNSKGKYSKATEQKVKKAVEKLGYTANVIAIKLKTGKTGTIGIVTSGPRLLYSPILISSSIKKLIAHGFFIEIVLDRTLGDCASLLEEGRFDGLLIIDAKNDESALKSLIDSDRKFVILGGDIEREDVNLVEIDYFLGGYLTTKLFISKGHTEILFIEDSISHYATNEIRRGYLFALDENGIGYREDLIVKYDNDVFKSREEFGYKIIKKLMKTENFSAVFTTDDRTAFGAIKGITEQGISIPDKLSITGFGNLSSSAYTTPPLTTVEVPLEQMAELGAEILVNNIKREDSIIKSVKLKPQLIERGTLAKFMPDKRYAWQKIANDELQKN